jgi:hypothetical protein
MRTEVGIEQASYYSTEPLRETLLSLQDFEYIGADGMRLTAGAVNANSGVMHYFDSRDQRLGVEHVMASGALPRPHTVIAAEPLTLAKAMVAGRADEVSAAGGQGRGQAAAVRRMAGEAPPCREWHRRRQTLRKRTSRYAAPGSPAPALPRASCPQC